MTTSRIQKLQARAALKMNELQGKGGRDVNLAEEVDTLFREIGIRTVGEGLAWSEVEIRHVLENLDVEYGDEAVITLANGRDIRCPAWPEPCSYVRVTQAGCELGYWVDAEWAQAPAEVMGAVLGLACASRGARVTSNTSDAPTSSCDMVVSLDGGTTFIPAREGVRILYPSAPLPDDGQPGSLSVNATSEGVIFDVWRDQASAGSANAGTEASTIEEIITRLAV